MSQTSLDVFDKTLQTTNIWLNEISSVIGPDRHLAWKPAGTWMDCFDAEGRPVADHIPASILYHVLLAVAELLRLEDRIKGGHDVGRERTGV